MEKDFPKKRDPNLHKKNKSIIGKSAEADKTTSRRAKARHDHKTGKLLGKNYLVNKLNFTNFQDGTILVNFRHENYDKTIALLAKPKNCLGDTLDCEWVEVNRVNKKFHSYQLDGFYISDGLKLISVTPETSHVRDDGVLFKLPDTCYEIRARKIPRHDCKDIKVHLAQKNISFYGELINFNAAYFCIELKAKPSLNFRLIDNRELVYVYFSDQTETLYAGECRIVRSSEGNKTRKYVLEPIKNNIKQLKQRQFRSPRQKLIPSPNIIFKHPFTAKRIDFKVIDIAGCGFSVEESIDNPLLLPGMIVPELELDFTQNVTIRCRAQVIYKEISEDKAGRVFLKCGFVFLDMAPADHVQLFSILYQAEDGNAYVCSEVDMDALWEFFFDTGFIYPHKYEFIQKNKEKIKNTYKKLYTDHPSIARHFIYKNKGRILGHMATVRFYNTTWLIHHHAAKTNISRKAGLKVLQQIGQFSVDSNRLHSSYMDYLLCYYQPDNKFPSRVFGGAARFIKNRKICSTYDFVYFHLSHSLSDDDQLSKPWRLVKTDPNDLLGLGRYYDNNSERLMIDGLNLTPDAMNLDELSKEYQKIGLQRERLIFSLKKGNQLKAVFMVNFADIGLNFSDLTRCIKVIVLDSIDLPGEIVQKAILSVREIINREDVPILLHPVSYAEKEMVSYEKVYTMWIINLSNTDSYFKFTNRFLRFVS